MAKKKVKDSIPDGMRVRIIDLKDEPKKICIVYKDGVPVFKVRSNSLAYITNRLWNYINKTNNKEK